LAKKDKDKAKVKVKVKDKTKVKDKKAATPHREFTKRQLSQWQRQKRRQRIILFTGIAIVAVVLVTVLVGWYSNQYKPMHEIVLRVNGTEFNMDYYIKTLKSYGRGQSAPYVQSIADQVLEFIQQNELVKQEALELGITISDDEVHEELESYDPPLDRDYKDIVRADMLRSKVGDEYLDEQVPVSAEHRHVMAMLLESRSQANEVRTRIEAGEDFGDLAAELSLDGYSKSRKGDLGWQLEDVLSEKSGSAVLEERAFSADTEVGVLSRPIHDEDRAKGVGYWLIKVVETMEDAEQVRVHGILLGSAEEAEEVKARLEAGEDFSELAQELSHHDPTKELGGDLGWLTPEEIKSIDDFIFDPDVELEKISEPIRDEGMVTWGGYWLMKVVDVADDKEIGEADRDLLKRRALNEWLTLVYTNPENEVEVLWNDEQKAWAVAQVTKSLELEQGGGR